MYVVVCPGHDRALPADHRRLSTWGDPIIATAEKRRQFFEVIVATSVEFLVESGRREVEVPLDFPLTHERTEIEQAGTRGSCVWRFDG